MNLFDNFNNNLSFLLKPTIFQPSRFINDKYGKKYTRSDYKRDKTMGCRGTAFYLFASLTNSFDNLNQFIFKREELDLFIKKYELISPINDNRNIDIPNKTIAILSLFGNVFERYYVPLHTFVLIRFDNESGNNFKILQSWNDGNLFISINKMSSDWTLNPIETILSIIDNNDVFSWKKLFGENSIYNMKDNDSIYLKYKFRYQVLIDKIDESWYN